MIDLTCIASAAHQLECAQAVASGVRAVGGSARVQRGEAASTKQVCCWGWRTGQRLRAKGHEVLVMERGYLGDRFEWYSLGWNGLNGRASFPERADADRFARHFGPLQPWKTGGEYVLLIGQVPGDMSLQGRDLRPWYSMTAMKAGNAYEMPVRFRPHPVALQRGQRHRPTYAEPIGGTLAECLTGASVCVTFNSNTGVDAVLAGVPTVAIDPGSMAWEVSAHRIGDIARPAREDWAARLAWRQWLLAEIEAGKPFEGMNA